MTVLQAIVLGVVQGATEFLPISSKTHLVVVPALLGWDTPSLAFVVMLHLGTLAALLVYFFREVVRIIRDLPRRGSSGRKTFLLIVVATIPAAVIGLAFEETFERLLSRPRPAALALLATAVVLVAAESLAGSFGGRRRLPKPLREAPDWRDAIAMGLAQAVALLPGVSRSGSTMGAGLAGGLSRRATASFSFLMLMPAIAGANVLELGEVVADGVSGAEVAGFIAAFVTGLLAVSWLLRYLRRRSFLPFAVYCVVFAVFAFVWLGLG